MKAKNFPTASKIKLLLAVLLMLTVYGVLTNRVPLPPTAQLGILTLGTLITVIFVVSFQTDWDKWRRDAPQDSLNAHMNGTKNKAEGIGFHLFFLTFILFFSSIPYWMMIDLLSSAGTTIHQKEAAETLSLGMSVFLLLCMMMHYLQEFKHGR